MGRREGGGLRMLREMCPMPYYKDIAGRILFPVSSPVWHLGDNVIPSPTEKAL